MKNALATLSRIEKFNITEQRKQLIILQEQQEDLIFKLKNLNLQFAQEKTFQAQHQLMGDFGAYIKKYLAEKENLETQIATLETQIEKIRNIITDMFKEQKTFEIVDDMRQKRAQHEENLKIQKQLDEIGTNNYIKHHDNNITGK